MTSKARLGLIAAFLACLISAALISSAAGARLDPAAVLATSEAAIGRMVGNHRLTTADGSELTMDDLRGRPLAVSLVYTRCSDVCPVTTQHLKWSVARARKALGSGSFAVLTVGFDARRDTPAQLAAFAADQDIADDPSWFVAGGDAATLERLLRDLGFSYSAAAGGFEHAAQTTILDKEGRVSRQVYGDDFPLPMFIEPLKALVFGTELRALTFSGLVDRVRFLCTVYDASAGHYRTDYSIFTGIALGAVSLFLMGWLIVRLWRDSRGHRLPPEGG